MSNNKAVLIMILLYALVLFMPVLLIGAGILVSVAQLVAYHLIISAILGMVLMVYSLKHLKKKRDKNDRK